jgi:hypothetical protein
VSNIRAVDRYSPGPGGWRAVVSRGSAVADRCEAVKQISAAPTAITAALDDLAGGAS